MKTLGVLTILSLALLPVAASAGDRGTDAALGAVSGAVVFGPVGAVAGALVGFTAGPAIGHSWGVNGSSGRYGRYRHRAQATGAAESRAQYSEPATGAGPAQAAAPASAPAAPAAAPPAAAPPQLAKNKAPPVQGLE
jgi:hypothetical protein